MENTKYGKRREGRWTPIRAKAQDTRANPNSWETHLVRKRWDIGLLRALSPRIMMMMMMTSRETVLLALLHNNFRPTVSQFLLYLVVPPFGLRPGATWLSLGHERLSLNLKVLLLWAHPTGTTYLSPL